MQQYWHINFPLKSQWYTVLHFHNRKNISCFPKNYRKPKSLLMLLAIWFIVYLQLSWECHAFMLTNYMGRAFMDQLERWELYFLQSLNHWLSKINREPVGDWPFQDWKEQESRTFGHSHIQTQSVFDIAQSCSYWDTRQPGEHGTLGKAGQEFCTQWIHHCYWNPKQASTQAVCLHEQCRRRISGLQPIQTDLFIWDWYLPILTCIDYSSSWVHSAGLNFFCNCANVNMFLVYKFTSF